MNVRVINKSFGYAFMAMGITKFFLAVMVIMNIYTAVGTFFSRTASDVSALGTFGSIVGIIELILFIASVVLLIINIKNEPSATLGYGIVLIIAIVEIISPTILIAFLMFVISLAYLKAGQVLLKYGGESVVARKTTKKEIKDTDWFYNDNNNNNE